MIEREENEIFFQKLVFSRELKIINGFRDE